MEVQQTLRGTEYIFWCSEELTRSESATSSWENGLDEQVSFTAASIASISSILLAVPSPIPRHFEQWFLIKMHKR